MATERLTFPIYGLARSIGGSLAIEHALTEEVGVMRATVNIALEMAYIEYDPGLTHGEQLVAAVHRVGFDTGVPLRR